MSAPSSRRTTPQFSLFNAADDCLAANIGIGSFEESLLLNIRFLTTDCSLTNGLREISK